MPNAALTFGYQELREGLDALGGLLPRVLVGRRPLSKDAVSPEGPAWTQDPPLSLPEWPGHVQGLALDTWTRSGCWGTTHLAEGSMRRGGLPLATAGPTLLG